MLLLAGSGVLVLGTVFAHDEWVYRTEFDPENALFKALYTAPGLVTGYEHVTLVEDSGASNEWRSRELGDGRYEVEFKVRHQEGTNVAEELPLRATMRCQGLDDWVLEDVQIGSDPPTRCDYELSPTGQANRLWTYKIYRALKRSK